MPRHSLEMRLVGDEIVTIYGGERLSGLSDVFAKITDPQDAKKFMAKLRKLTQHADSNVGYFTGYYDAEKTRELQEHFGVAHPIFGKSTPTAAEALLAGVRAGKRVAKRT